MANRSRQKGTEGENYFLAGLRAAWSSSVERAPLKGTADYGDYVGVPWLHEAKSTAAPKFLEWARKATAKTASTNGRWVVMWKGDLRKKEGPYVLMPYEMYLTILDLVRDHPKPDDPAYIRLMEGEPF
jgi:hypothetical protein